MKSDALVLSANSWEKPRQWFERGLPLCSERVHDDRLL